NDLHSAYQKGAETGDYKELGKAVAEVFGGVVGTYLGTALAAAIASVVAGASLPFVAVAVIVVATAWFVSDKFGEWFGYWIGDKFNDWFGLNRSGLFHIYDPLVLDLDGDGVELVSADGWNGVQFDFNGNGIKTATQWVKSDDGLLVWDRNNNGAIDDGSELFGQDTPTKYGDPVTDGFSALKTVESMEYKNSIIGAANDTIFVFQAA
ncbi:MAG: hypothetical protein IKX14_02275, partial [Neisseriaceae bacterium]|nr:hypothetical protein [Neisseriaceae bacterium]